MASSPDPLVVHGRDALASGDLRRAQAAADERLRSVGDDLQALELRYLIQQRRGHIGAAAETLQTVIGIDPGADWARSGLIELALASGKLADAEQAARAALRANPDNAPANALFGRILSELNDLPSGEWHFRRALALAGPQARVCTSLAVNLMKQGRTAEADAAFAEAHALAPRDMQTLAYWSNLAEVQGDLARAAELLERAQAVSSAAEVNLLRANYLARAARNAEALAILDAAGTLNGDGQLERGRLLDRLGRFAEAWSDFVEAKRKLAREGGGLEYHADLVEAFFARLKEFFTRDNLRHLPRAKVRADVAQPIFIMGFPRSGTTLVEQILCSHSAVRPGGELTFLGELRKLANQLFPAAEAFPANLAQTWTADHTYAASLFRDYYLARADQYGLTGGCRFFTDKMPFNELWLPLLQMAFPEAKIIRVIRHPLDVCVSMLSNHLTHGFNCGYRLEDIAHHLAAVADLTGHYHRELAADEFVLRYESLVADQAVQTRELFAYLGLRFEEAALRFHENPRYAPTPSYAQVSEKLNDRSVNRHRHYAQQLQPCLPRLAPVIAACGYG
jgi:Flp pilus assembly protein TadD